MPTVIGYVSRLFLGRLGIILFSFAALLQVFDLLKNADKVMQRHGENILALMHYAGLRLPETISFLLPLCVLMASLLTLTRLAQHNELLALKAAGLSIYRLLLAFMPAALVISGLHFLLSDQIMPIAKRAMIQWDAQSQVSQTNGPKKDRATWLRSGSTVVRVESVASEGTELRGITLFLRDAKGNLVERVTGRAARHAAGQWELFDVQSTAWPVGQLPEVTRSDRMPWASDLRPSLLVSLSTPPSGLSLQQLTALADNPEIGEHPGYFYETWLHKKISVPFVSLLMILLAAPMAQTLRQSHSITASFAAGLGLGFIYLIADGVILTLGEAGTFHPILAAWVPVLLFASIGGSTLISMEGY